MLFEPGVNSPTFYAKLIYAQITKAQKNTIKPSVFFALSGSVLVKAYCIMFVKLTLDLQSQGRNPVAGAGRDGDRGQTCRKL